MGLQKGSAHGIQEPVTSLDHIPNTPQLITKFIFFLLELLMWECNWGEGVFVLVLTQRFEVQAICDGAEEL